MTAYDRLKDSRNGWKFAGDMYREVGGLKAAGVTAASVGTALGISVGVPTPAIITFVSAVAGGVALSDKMAKSYAPGLYHKIKRKFQ